MDDLVQNPDDKMETDPADIGPEFFEVVTLILAKRLANERNRPWTNQQESDLQAKTAALVAAANKRKLKTIRVVVTRPNGQKVTREMDVGRISKTRSLQ